MLSSIVARSEFEALTRWMRRISASAWRLPALAAGLSPSLTFLEASSRSARLARLIDVVRFPDYSKIEYSGNVILSAPGIKTRG